MTGQRIGYIRVSTFDQNTDRQLEGIQVDRIFTDKGIHREQLEILITFVRSGDTVVVHSMDRLARNLDDLRRIVQLLTRDGIRIEFIKENLSFTGEDSPMANLMLSVMGEFARKTGLDWSVVSRHLKLLNLPFPILEYLEKNQTPEVLKQCHLKYLCSLTKLSEKECIIRFSTDIG